MVNKVDKTHPDHEYLMKLWVKAGNPSRFSCALGDFMAVQNDGEMFFLKIDKVDPNITSFGSY